eukprot:GILI01071667.1.p1 GENE.GILI01071667.1~~GILI01071667.1.p1  ORF type:complete len:140 (-),score=13.67 GILI01071667.1:52-414(-)
MHFSGFPKLASHDTTVTSSLAPPTHTDCSGKSSSLVEATDMSTTEGALRRLEASTASIEPDTEGGPILAVAPHTVEEPEAYPSGWDRSLSPIEKASGRFSGMAIWETLRLLKETVKRRSE